MMRRIRSLARLLTGLLLVALLLAACNQGAGVTPLPALSVTGISPERASAEGGTTVTLTGENFFEVLAGTGFPGKLSVSVCGVPLGDLQVEGERRDIAMPPAQSLRIRIGDSLTGTLAASEPTAEGDVLVTRPDGQQVRLEGVFECYDPTPVVSAFSLEPSPAVAMQEATFSWSLSSPGGEALSCILNPGDGSEPYTLEGCLATTSQTHTYIAQGSYTARLVVRDAQGHERSQSLQITVDNAPPVASFTATPDTGPAPLTVHFDATPSSDPDGDPLSYAISNPPQHGELSGNAPALTYTPEGDFHGNDSFTFKVSDGSLDSSPATVTITVDEVNDKPVAENDSYTVAEDTALPITLNGSDSDGDALSYAIVSGPSHGSLSGNGAERSYTPDENFNGADSFTFKVNDGQANSNTVTVTITVTPVNDAPVAEGGSYTVAEDTTFPITLSGSDGDVSVYSTNGAGFNVKRNDDGSFSYTPDKDFNGTDSFTFRVWDGSLFSSPATVTITVTPVNDPARITSFSADTNSVRYGEPVTFSWEVMDPEGDPLVCELDHDGDGDVDYSLDPCPAETIISKPMLYLNKDASYTPELVVNDGASATAGPVSVQQVNLPLSAGRFHSLALTSDGRVIAWGYNSDGQADPQSGILQP